ncbi:MAG: cyclic nucleotide-binding domain-containing protein [Anaerolineales bacterium]|nr:cyclic nucleotide-binding domain-containing protein [Anaerolineales bacterium]
MTTHDDPTKEAPYTRGLPPTIWTRLHQDNKLFLAKVPLFRGLPDDQLEPIVDIAESQHYERGEVIIEQGSPNEHIYFLKDGLVGVTRLAENGRGEEVVSYFHGDHIFGEFGLFSSGQHIATATVSALTEVNLIRIQHKAFIDTLNDYHPAALEVARILTQRLQNPTDKLIPASSEQNIYFVMGMNKGAGATTLGSALATSLAKEEPGKIVYTEYPDGHELPDEFGFGSNDFYHHPANFDVFVPLGMPRLAPAVNVNLILERLQRKYKYVILSLPAKMMHELGDLMEQVDRIILIASPARWLALQDTAELLETSPFMEENSVIRVSNYCYAEYASYPKPEDANFIIPFMVGLDLSKQKTEGLPEQLAAVSDELGSRLSSLNDILIYLPREVENSEGEKVSTGPALEKLMWIMKGFFGEVSRMDGEEGFHVIQSRTTAETLNRKWREVVQQVYQIKLALQLEAIAIEINRNLALV